MNVCLAGAMLKPVGLGGGGGGGWKRLVNIIALLDDSTSSKSRDHSLVTAMYPILPSATAIKIFDRQNLLLIA